MTEFKRILVFGAHPDDEIIGPGGTIARCSRNGARVVVVTFSLGETGYSDAAGKDSIKPRRSDEMAAADRVLGISERILLGIEGQAVQNDKQTFHRCIEIIRRERPEVIFTHYHGDKHRDHRAVSAVTEEAWYKAAENVLPELGGTWSAPDLYYYEIFELFEYPDLIVDISGTIDTKTKAALTQESQADIIKDVEKFIRGLAMVRGFQAQVSCGEAFLRGKLMPKIIHENGN